MTKFYSQKGEDFLLNEIFRDRDDGFFVEVGCIDGKRFSNTLLFEEKGWKGLCIEAHADYIDFIKENRPNSAVIHAAVGEKDEDAVTFYANARGSLSSLDPSTEERWKKDYSEYFTGFKNQTVNKRTLNTIFNENHVSDIDILSIDIEGYEIEALEGLDLNKYRPHIIIIESDTKEQLQKLNSILNKHKYALVGKLGDNLFYSINKKDARYIHNRLFKNIELIHGGNPIDKEADITKTVNIDTRIFTMNKLIGYLARAKNALKKIKPKKYAKFYNIGFHGDLHFIKIIFACLAKSEQFIETGTNVGSTVNYVANNFPGIDIYSCEPGKDSFDYASKKLKKYKQVTLKNEFSPAFFHNLEKNDKQILEKDSVFWLDSHGCGFEWPLKEEVEYITNNFKSGYIFIDDFKNPRISNFGYDQYNNQVCEWNYIKDNLNKSKTYTIVYPNYTERTSQHHSLRGWVLIEFGHTEPLDFPENLKKLIFIKNND